jgi:glycerol-3-phosphate dehydrogenase (NAD(P)+)
VPGNKVGVIGSGSFGTTIAALASKNSDVLLYSRKKEIVDKINNSHTHLGVELAHNITATNDLKELATNCILIFPVVTSHGFRSMMKDLGKHVGPAHILIHGTKGLDIDNMNANGEIPDESLTRENVKTMSEIIMEESSVVRIGCLSGPNLANEILQGQPTATVIASEFEEVIEMGRNALASEQFFVFGSFDIKGTELAGAYKNIIALASGILAGLNMGKNIQALLITRGLREMIYFGKAMGSDSRSFIGTAGIGDLVATATSENSRNYKFGYRLGKGETVDEIMGSVREVVEGYRTLKIAYQLSKRYHIHVPITKMLYKVVYQDTNMKDAIGFLMNYPYAPDVDFI